MKKFYKTMFFVVLTLFFTKSSFADLRHDQGKAEKQNAYDFEFVSIDGESFSLNPVSYTHLTLPTSDLV